MGSLSPHRLRIVIALVLTFVAALASAGHYVVTYSGGQFSGTGASGAYTHPLAVKSGGYGGEEFPPFYANGSAALSGKVIATLTWTPSTDPLPDSVVLYEYADVSIDINSPGAMTTAPTLGDPQQTVTIYSNSSGGRAHLVRYSVIANPGATITCAYNPQGGGSGTHIQGLPPDYHVAANFQVDAQVPTIALSGGTSQTPGDYLVGQQMNAGLYAPFGLYPASHGTTPACQWSIVAGGATEVPRGGGSGTNGLDGGSDDPIVGTPMMLPNGDPFKSFEWTRRLAFYQDSHGIRNELTASDYQMPTLQACFAQAADPVTVACAAHLAVPAGALPAEGLDVSASAAVHIKIPEVKQYNPHWVNPISIETTPNGPGTETLIKWAAAVTTPTEFVSGTDSGGWLWMQTIAFGSTRTLNDGTTVQAKQTGPDGQGNYHLKGIDVNFGYTPYPPAQGTQAAPGTFTAPDNIQLFYADSRCDSTMSEGSDMPGEILQSDAKSYHLHDQFQTWLMYRPPGSGSQFVPLRAFDWLYGGDLAWNGSNWNLSNAAPPTTPDVLLTPIPTPFPQWNQILDADKTNYRVSDAHTLP